LKKRGDVLYWWKTNRRLPPCSL